jgi:hypothetical protein
MGSPYGERPPRPLRATKVTGWVQKEVIIVLALHYSPVRSTTSILPMWGVHRETQYQSYKKDQKYPKLGFILQKRADFRGVCDKGLSFFAQG